MPFQQTTRKLILLVHILASVGWVGAVASFLALALTGLLSTDPQMIRAAYLAMEPITRGVIVPLAFTSLTTGLLLSLGTKWGLLRHYWILIKLVINTLSLPILLLHTRIIHRVATAAAVATTSLSSYDLHQDRIQLIIIAIAALAALLIATLLSVYKPSGLTPYGWRRQYP